MSSVRLDVHDLTLYSLYILMSAGAGFVYGADVLMSTIGVGDPAELWRQEAHRDSADSTSAALHQVT